jgi:hypothetical protein
MSHSCAITPVDPGEHHRRPAVTTATYDVRSVMAAEHDPPEQDLREPDLGTDGELDEDMLALLGHDGATLPVPRARRAGQLPPVEPGDPIGEAGTLRFCGRTGRYRGVAGCWFASDGTVYGPSGERLGPS